MNKRLTWTLIISCIAIFLLVVIEANAGNNHDNVPRKEYEKGKHKKNPHCQPSPTITNIPTIALTDIPRITNTPTPTKEITPTITPTPTATPTATPTPTPTPTIKTEDKNDNPSPIVKTSEAKAPQCEKKNTTEQPVNSHVYRNGDTAIVKWWPTDGNKINIYYKENTSANWQYSYSQDNTGYAVINGLKDMDITFALQQVNDCSGGSISEITKPIVDDVSEDWRLYR